MQIFLQAIFAVIFFISEYCSAGESTTYIDAAIHDGSLIAVTGNSKLVAWNLDSGDLNEELSGQLSAIGAEYVASSDAGLWGLYKGVLYQWEASRRNWKEIEGSFPAKQYIELAAIDDSIYVIYPKKIIKIGTRKNKTYKVPRLDGQLKIDYLRILDMQVSGTNLCFGTGQGEWGGHLVKLDTATGKWDYYYDPLHYATGIAPLPNGEMAVSWAMSHFMASSRLRIHAGSSAVKTQFDELDSQYLQKIVYDKGSDMLLGIEQDRLVRLEQGKPLLMAGLGDMHYDSEPDAIGISPGVLALFVTAESRIVIVRKFGSPLIYGSGRLEALQEPSATKP
jgi:hypothetical protein